MVVWASSGSNAVHKLQAPKIDVFRNISSIRAGRASLAALLDFRVGHKKAWGVSLLRIMNSKGRGQLGSCVYRDRQGQELSCLVVTFE